MTTTKQRTRGVDGYAFKMTRSKTVPGAFDILVTKTYRPDVDGSIHEEEVKKSNLSLSEVTGFLEENLAKAYF